MSEDEKWIGEETDTSGIFVRTKCPEVSVRKGGRSNAVKMYQIESRFGGVYNVTDKAVIAELEQQLETIDEDSVAFYEYLFSLIAKHFGVMELVFTAQRKIQEQRSEGYVDGQKAQQIELQRVLGLR